MPRRVSSNGKAKRIEDGLIVDGHPCILLTHDVARILNCSTKHVYRLVSQGSLQSLDQRPWSGKPIRVERAELAKHLAG